MKLKSILLLSVLLIFSITACKSKKTDDTAQPVEANMPAPNDNQKAINQGFELPEIPPAKLFQHVQPEMFKLNNGMDVWYVYNPMVPLMSFKVVFEQGASADPADKSGRTSFTAAMLKEGAAGKSAQQISDDIEYIGASLQPNVTQDASAITLQVMTQFFDRGLDILSDIWLKPDFSQESFDRLQKIILNGLKQREDSPGTVAKLAAANAFYGDAHPYGRSIDGYISTISATTLDDLRAAYKEVFSFERASIVAVGNIETEAFKKQMNQHFGSVERAVSEKKALEIPAEPEHKQAVIIVDKPGAPQTVIRIYQPAVSAPSLKTLPWQFVNIPFGGSFTSRLMQNIREDKGYSYGANSAVAPQKLGGIFLSTSSVETAVTGAALKEFISELSRLPKGDFTQEEFERARETWKSELVQSFETQAGVLATISALYLNHKPVDAINNFARQLQTMTLDDFNNFAREFPTLDTATIVLVGDKTAILDQIKDLNLPEPSFRNAEGKRIDN
jgi:zinc protease